MKQLARLAALISIATVAAEAQTEMPWPDTPFVEVRTDSALNLRRAPSTEAERITRFADGTMLRRIDCLAIEGRHWCEVEIVGGGIAGWAAAEYLAAYYGADPAALMMPAVAADSVTDTSGGRLAGTLPPAAIHDFRISVGAATTLSIAPVAIPSGVTVIVFGSDGQALTELTSEAAAKSLEFLSGDQVLVRLVEMAGRGGDYDLELRID